MKLTDLRRRHRRPRPSPPVELPPPPPEPPSVPRGADRRDVARMRGWPHEVFPISGLTAEETHDGSRMIRFVAEPTGATLLVGDWCQVWVQQGGEVISYTGILAGWSPGDNVGKMKISLDVTSDVTPLPKPPKLPKLSTLKWWTDGKGNFVEECCLFVHERKGHIEVGLSKTGTLPPKDFVVMLVKDDVIQTAKVRAVVRDRDRNCYIAVLDLDRIS